MIIRFSFTALSLFACCFSSSAGNNVGNNDTIPKKAISKAGYDAPSSYAGYKLVWSDEFNGKAVDTSSWTFITGDGCPGNCGFGNNELQWYQPQNATFQDGKMIITAKSEKAGTKDFTSTKIESRNKKVFKYGRIDFRAILPKGQGIWPAFWMMPNDDKYGSWPTSGELDIMEMIGKEPNTTYGTLHFGPGPGSTQLGGKISLPAGILNDKFHVYSLEWKEDEIKWLLDGVVFSTHKRSEFGTAKYPFNENFFFIINLAVGGNWPGNPDGTSTYPQQYVIDYVRVYQQ